MALEREVGRRSRFARRAGFTLAAALAAIVARGGGLGADPAKVRAASTAAEALRRVRESGATFVSRGDDSGTHKRERELWGKGFAPWPGYVETGQGMGPTLTIADQKDAYTLCDEGT